MRRLAAVFLFVNAAAARAEDAAAFYRDKQIFLVHSGGDGGGFATYAQTIAPYLGKHMPGRPRVIVQTMPGAGGIRLLLNFTSIAPRDGTMIGLSQSGALFAPLLGVTQAQFDPRKLTWLGAMSRVNSVCTAWRTADVKTFDDILTKPYVVGSSGAGSLADTQPNMLNRLFGAHIRIVSGYPGANDIYLAMERGEVQGRCGGGLPSLEVARPGWVRDGVVNLLVQFGLERGKGLGEVPTVYEKATDERTRAILRLALAPVEMNRPVFTTPETPPDRVAALRDAFHAALTDPDFLAEAARARLEIEENSADRITKIIADAYALPADIIADARAAMGLAKE